MNKEFVPYVGGYTRRSLSGAQENGLLIRAFDLNAMRFHGRVVLQGIVNDAAIEGVERFQFDDVAPAADFFGGLLGFSHQRVTGLGAIAAHIHGDFGRGGVLLKQKTIEQVLKVCERLALAANQPSGFLSLDIEQEAFFEVMFLHGGVKAQMLQQFFQGHFWICWHRDQI